MKVVIKDFTFIHKIDEEGLIIKTELEYMGSLYEKNMEFTCCYSHLIEYSRTPGCGILSNTHDYSFSNLDKFVGATVLSSPNEIKIVENKLEKRTDCNLIIDTSVGKLTITAFLNFDEDCKFDAILRINNEIEQYLYIAEERRDNTLKYSI